MTTITELERLHQELELISEASMLLAGLLFHYASLSRSPLLICWVTVGF